MVHMQPLRFSAPFTASSGSIQRDRPCRFPTRSLASAITTFPTRRVRSDHEFRLPFSHTRVIAKGAFAVKVGPRSLDSFATPGTGSPRRALPTWIRLTFQARPVARLAAVLLRSLVGVEHRSAFVATTVGNISTPSASDIARVGTKPPGVARRTVEVFPTLSTSQLHPPILAGIDVDECNYDLERAS